VDVFAREADALMGAAVFAAHEIGLFDAPDLPIPALAARLGVGPRRLRALVSVIRAGGWPDAIPPRPAPPPPYGIGRLAEVLLTDAPLAETADLGRYHQHLVAEASAAADPVFAALGPARRLLDLGGGAGGFTDAFLRRNPEARALLVDRPEVIALAATHLAAHRGRVDFAAGDLADADLGGGHDLALLSNVTHGLAPDACARVIARATASLAPGGRLAVKDLFIEPDRRGPMRSLLFGLCLAAYSDAGDVYDADETAAWLRAAGLRDVTCLRLPRDEMLVWGARP
jgi:hypothetical protein